MMKNNYGLTYSLPDGAIALVTGGSQGIGRAMVVRLAAIAPGFVDTEMSNEATTEMMKTRIPLKRAGTVDEVSGALAYLCSDEAGYVTGQVLNVNGGLST